MADLSIQFHALPDEIVPLVCSFVDEVHVSVSAIKYQPFVVTPINTADLSIVLRDVEVRRVAFTLVSPALPARGMNEFLDRNPDAMLLDVGKVLDAGLQESWLTARTRDASTLGIWRKLSKRVLAATATGAIAVNPKTGATAPAKGHRFSTGAKAMDRAGVPMLPAAGTARFRFND
jgi:hypothetical protein